MVMSFSSAPNPTGAYATPAPMPVITTSPPGSLTECVALISMSATCVSTSRTPLDLSVGD